MLAGFGSYSPNSSRLQDLENAKYTIAYYSELNGTSGTITPPTGATIVLNQLPGGADALVSTIDGSPTGISPRTSGGVVVDVTSFDGSGNFVLSGTPSAYPVALIYWFDISASDYANLSDSERGFIIEENYYANYHSNYQITLISNDQVAASSTEQCGIAGSGNWAITAQENRRRTYMTHDGVFEFMGVGNATTQPADGSLVITLYKNGSATAKTITIDAATSSNTYTTDSGANQISFVAGDYFNWYATNNSSSKSALLSSIVLRVKYNP